MNDYELLLINAIFINIFQQSIVMTDGDTRLLNAEMTDGWKIIDWKWRMTDDIWGMTEDKWQINDDFFPMTDVWSLMMMTDDRGLATSVLRLIRISENYVSLILAPAEGFGGPLANPMSPWSLNYSTSL